MPAHVAFAPALDGIAQVLSAKPTLAALVADDAESAAAGPGVIARVHATSDIYIAFGPTGTTASATTGYAMATGQTLDFGRIQPGWVAAVAAR